MHLQNNFRGCETIEFLYEIVCAVGPTKIINYQVISKWKHL